MAAMEEEEKVEKSGGGLHLHDFLGMAVGSGDATVSLWRIKLDRPILILRKGK